jgi:hypothetical protein
MTPPKPIEDTQAIPVDIRETAKEVLHKACRTIFKDEAINIIAQAILAERERNEWQPISTAPKDGTVFFGKGDLDSYPQPMRWAAYSPDRQSEMDEDGFWDYAEELISDISGWASPSVWMHIPPLPSPPKTDKPKGNNRFSRKGE